MKKLLTVLMLGLFSFAVIGCEASAEIDDDNGDTYRKKTTTIDDDGDRTVKTEIRKTDRD